MSNQTKLAAWKIISSKIVHATPWVEVIADTCEADNKAITYTFVKRVDEGPLIIAEDANQKLWLVRQYRHPIGKIVWQFPVEGKLQNESWEQAAARGLQEEIKLTAQNWHDLGQFYVDPGGSNQKYHAYLATNLTKNLSASVLHDDEVESLEIQSFTRKEIDALIDTGELCDNWTLAALFLYDRHKRKIESTNRILTS